MASAAAAKSLVLFGADMLEREPIIAKVDATTCTGCLYCQKVCAYNAIEKKEIRDRQGNLKKVVAYVNSGLCQGCGTCNATCPSKSIELIGFKDDQIFAQINAFAEV
jgi:heterodisulfide reductase subunit A